MKDQTTVVENRYLKLLNSTLSRIERPDVKVNAEPHRQQFSGSMSTLRNKIKWDVTDALRFAHYSIEENADPTRQADLVEQASAIVNACLVKLRNGDTNQLVTLLGRDPGVDTTRATQLAKDLALQLQDALDANALLKTELEQASQPAPVIDQSAEHEQAIVELRDTHAGEVLELEQKLALSEGQNANLRERLVVMDSVKVSLLPDGGSDADLQSVASDMVNKLNQSAALLESMTLQNKELAQECERCARQGRPDFFTVEDLKDAKDALARLVVCPDHGSMEFRALLYFVMSRFDSLIDLNKVYAVAAAADLIDTKAATATR